MIPDNTKTGPIVCACIFQREKDGPWEWGFDINYTTVCDSSGKVVTDIWDLKPLPAWGAMSLPIVMDDFTDDE